MITILALLLNSYDPPTEAQRASNVEKIMNMRVFAKDEPDSPVADLTLVDLSKVLTLPARRREELRCAGRAFAKDSKVPAAARDRLIAEVAPILAAEAGMTLPQADDFIRMYAKEPAYRTEGAICGPLWRAAASGSPIPLLAAAAH